MKWVTLQKRVAEGVYTTVLRGLSPTLEQVLIDLLRSDFAVLRALPDGKRHCQAIRTKYADAAYDHVMKWDVRAVGQLRDLFPELFPRCLVVGVLTLDYDEDGWHVTGRKIA